MAKHSFWSRLRKNLLKSRLKSRKHSSQGFTLLELLVVTAIAGGIVAGLTFIVVQMMTADQRESARSETQREMQLALDYIAAELREAIYIYPGSYLTCAGVPGNCQNFSDFLPTAVSQDSVPVLAFWKQQPFPAQVKARCASAPQPGVACLSGQSYALVVYSLARNTDNRVWKGKARITRYVLSQFDSNGNSNESRGYVDPGENRNFTTWPFGNDPADGQLKNLQRSRPTAPGGIPTLVDFVGLDYPDATVSNELGQTGFCPAAASGIRYEISPPNALLTGQFNGVRSFYACIAAPETTVQQNGQSVTLPDPSQYRDVIVYLRGSATGRPGILPNIGRSDAELLPTLQTRVLSRSVLGRTPTN